MNLDLNWKLVALGAAAALCLVLAWQVGVEWLLGAGAAVAEAARDQRPGPDVPDRPPAEEAETTDTIDETAAVHSEEVGLADADSPTELVERQADRLDEDQ